MTSRGWHKPCRCTLPVLLTAFLLRIGRLDERCPWWDQAFLAPARNSSLYSPLQATLRDRVHPPPHHPLLHLWIDLGQKELLTRALSASVGILARGCILAVADLGMMTALALAISPFDTKCCQEANYHGLNDIAWHTTP